ncbi:NTP transferase domain-containing protein [Halostagnicola bangensis]
MCGGRGTRLESPHEKPLHPIDGTAMIDHVRRALESSRVESIYAAVSPNATETAAHLKAVDEIKTIETAGDGYVTDLMSALECPELTPPVLTVAADLPALEGTVLDRLLVRHGDDTDSRTICVPAALKRRLGICIDSRLEDAPHLVPTGVNVVGTTSQDMTDVSYDPRLAINVNRLEETRVASEIRSDRAGERIRSDRAGKRGDPCE